MGSSALLPTCLQWPEKVLPAHNRPWSYRSGTGSERRRETSVRSVSRRGHARRAARRLDAGAGQRPAPRQACNAHGGRAWLPQAGEDVCETQTPRLRKRKGDRMPGMRGSSIWSHPSWRGSPPGNSFWASREGREAYHLPGNDMSKYTLHKSDLP